MSEVIQKEKRVNQFWFVWNLIESLVLFAGGVLAIVAGVLTKTESASTPSTIENAVAYVVAGFVILDGILRIVMFLSRATKDDEQSPLVVAGFEISLGILLVLLQTHFGQGDLFTFTVAHLIAIVLMVMGFLLLIYAIYAIAKRMVKLVMPIMEILFAAILVAVGVVIEVLYNTSSSRSQLVLILTGSILALAAVGMFIITLITHSRAVKQLRLAEEEERGDYRVDRKRKAKPRVDDEAQDAYEDDVDEIQEAEIIGEPNQLEHDEPQALEGPRAIGKKK